MTFPNLLISVLTLVIFVPMAVVYFYRAYENTTKRVAKVLKGLNYLLVLILIWHGTSGVVPIERFVCYLIVAVGMIAVLELAYHIDVLLDIKDALIGRFRHRRN